jgi:hypothetical protein
MVQPSTYHFRPLTPFSRKVRGWHFDYSSVPGSQADRPITRRVYEVVTRWVLLKNIFQPWTHQFQPLPQWSKNSCCLPCVDFSSLVDGTNVSPTASCSRWVWLHVNAGSSANEDGGATAADIKSGRSRFHGCFAEILFDGDGRGREGGSFFTKRLCAIFY